MKPLPQHFLGKNPWSKEIRKSIRMLLRSINSYYSVVVGKKPISNLILSLWMKVHLEMMGNSRIIVFKDKEISLGSKFIYKIGEAFGSIPWEISSLHNQYDIIGCHLLRF
jgi:hypothetical protein